MNSKNPRVRFAPSPTGELHLGGARTALFNWLFARHHDGQFLLRIEDTDQARSREEFTQQIFDSLSWLGLDWDEEPLYQSKRGDRYSKMINILLATEDSYRCFCSKEELTRKREKAQSESGGYMYDGSCRALSEELISEKLSGNHPFVVRLKVPRKVLKFQDHIYGEIEVNTEEIDDFIVARSDGNPTYNLVVVIDDHDMDITHVIRGEDHVSNTPKQIMIYEALGFPIPEFAHLPMILGPDKRRLSKRHGAAGVQEYRDNGYLPGALINYLSLLGWNPDTEKEIFSLHELAQSFQINQVQKKPAVYDEKKLHWISGQHIFNSTVNDLFEGIRKMNPDWRGEEEDEFLIEVIELLKLRAKSLTELQDISEYFFEDPKSYDEKASRKHWKDNTVSSLVQQYCETLNTLDEWTEDGVEQALRNVADDEGISAGKLIHPVRLSLSGVPAGPSLFAMMGLLGRETCLRRLESALQRFPLQET